VAIWWDNVKLIWPTEEEITWEKFKDQFRKYHIPAGILKVKQRGFLALTQGNSTMTEYLNKFNHLARYSAHDVDTEERKIDRFLGGLNQTLRCALSMLDFPNFQTLVNKALIAEREHKLAKDHKAAYEDRKRKFEPKKEGQVFQKIRTWQQPQFEFKPTWQQGNNKTENASKGRMPV
jgi:hypothetical protein